MSPNSIQTRVNEKRSKSRYKVGIIGAYRKEKNIEKLLDQICNFLQNEPDILNKFEFVLRKFKEWIIATKLERNYTKEEILSMYLNKFDFLNNAVGINSAAQVYFSKTPDQLELHDSAMLVGMAKNPSLFNPIRRPDKVLKRRAVVLYQMFKNNYISQADFDSTKKLALDLDYNKVDHQTGLAPYFREILRVDLGKILAQKNENGGYIISKSNVHVYYIT